jgi:hypothetical protein
VPVCEEGSASLLPPLPTLAHGLLIGAEPATGREVRVPIARPVSGAGVHCMRWRPFNRLLRFAATTAASASGATLWQRGRTPPWCLRWCRFPRSRSCQSRRRRWTVCGSECCRTEIASTPRRRRRRRRRG